MQGMKKAGYLLFTTSLMGMSGSLLANINYHGVWQGKLGNTPIRVCFNTDSDHFSASYYDQNFHSVVMRLDDSGDWLEYDVDYHKTGDVWHIESVVGDQLNVSRRSEKTGQSLPIQLSRLNREDEACASHDYASYITKNMYLKKGDWQEKQGVRYRETYYGMDQSIELDPTFPGARQLNAQLTSELLDSENIDWQIGVRTNALANFGHDGFDEVSVSPVVKNNDFIGINFYHWTYGTGARGISSVDKYYSLSDGQEFNPWNWFYEGIGVEYGNGDYAQPLPADMLAKYFPETIRMTQDDECYYYNKPEFYISFEEQGKIKFWEWEDGSGCDGRRVTLSMKEAMQFATAEGRTAMEKLIE